MLFFPLLCRKWRNTTEQLNEVLSTKSKFNHEMDAECAGLRSPDGRTLTEVRHLIRDSCTRRRAAIVSQRPINPENNWGNIFSSKGEPRRRRRGGEGE